MKKLKQGQTLYIVRVDTIQFPQPEVILQSFFLYSQNEPLPEEGYIITKMPVSYMKETMGYYPSDYYTHSRRKALTRFNQLVRQHEER